jgi:[NiFe] hydrogenase assembly HybE family chaperone
MAETIVKATIVKMVQQFETIYVEHMRGLPVVNKALAVEAVGFHDYSDHQLGVLITPWFMNLILLPGTDGWSSKSQGDMSSIDFPSGQIEFAVSHDKMLGTYLSAVLFRSVTDIADQVTARKLAHEVLGDLMKPPRNERTVSRRDLLTGLRAR